MVYFLPEMWVLRRVIGVYIAIVKCFNLNLFKCTIKIGID